MLKRASSILFCDGTRRIRLVELQKRSESQPKLRTLAWRMAVHTFNFLSLGPSLIPVEFVPFWKLSRMKNAQGLETELLLLVQIPGASDLGGERFIWVGVMREGSKNEIEHYVRICFVFSQPQPLA